MTAASLSCTERREVITVFISAPHESHRGLLCVQDGDIILDIIQALDDSLNLYLEIIVDQVEYCNGGIR